MEAPLNVAVSPSEQEDVPGLKQMKVKRYLVWLSPLLFLCVSVFVLAHAAQQNRTFTVAGHPGEIPLAEMGGLPMLRSKH
jgi:hypothetical protein